MARLNLYCRAEDKPLVELAGKLLQLHEDKSMSALMVEQAKEIVRKYKGKGKKAK